MKTANQSDRKKCHQLGKQTSDSLPVRSAPGRESCRSGVWLGLCFGLVLSVSDHPMHGQETGGNATPNAAAKPAQEEKRLVQEVWQAFYTNNQKIGYQHTVIHELNAGGRAVLHGKNESTLTVKRFNDTMTITQEVNTYSLPDGQLYGFDSTLKTGKSVIRSKGRLVSKDEMLIEVRNGDDLQSKKIPWSGNIFSADIVELIWAKKKYEVGEEFTIKTFLPDMNLVAEAHYKILRKEKTLLYNGENPELFAVQMNYISLPDIPEMIAWIDEQGQTLKASTQLFGGLSVEIYRVGEVEALVGPVESSLDLGNQTLVAVNRPIPGVHQAAAAVYKLYLPTAATTTAIAESAYQKIMERGTDYLKVKIESIVPATAEETDSQAAAEYLQSNTFVQAEDAAVQSMAKSVTENQSDVWQRACKLERWVAQNLSNQDFSIGFDSAATVIKTRKGDCTEHAVLLTALCRAIKIPARVVMGLVYVEKDQKFGYHMWTEVLIGKVWYPLDGTMGQGRIGAGHIKLADSSLNGVSAISTLLPIFKVIGKLRLEVESVQATAPQNS